MKRETQTVFYCDNCDGVYDNEQDCYNCEQADRIISVMTGISEKFNFLDEKEWKGESGIDNRAMLAYKLRPVFEGLWGENGSHVGPVGKRAK
jgi:hypothetical protein